MTLQPLLLILYVIVFTLAYFAVGYVLFKIIIYPKKAAKDRYFGILTIIISNLLIRPLEASRTRLFLVYGSSVVYSRAAKRLIRARH